MTDQVNEAVAWLYTYPHDGESDHCLSVSRFLPSWVEAKGATERPLYDHPSRGVVDEAMVERACAGAARVDGIEWDDTNWQAAHQIEAGRLRTRITAALQAAALPADEIDPNSRNFKQGMAVGLAELAMVREAIDTRQCNECGARNLEEARTLCRPSGDSCPGTEWPLADLWDKAAQPAVPSVPEGCRFFASGPETSFFVAKAHSAEHLIDAAGFDRDEWTVTDLAATPKDQPAQGMG